MTKTGLPSYPAYVMPTLQAIKSRGGSATIEEIEDGVADAMSLSDEALAIPHGTSVRTEFQYKLAWVRTYLKKAGALQNSERGVWALTERGEKFTDDNARTLFQRVRAQNYEKRKDEFKTTPLLDDVDDDQEEGWVEHMLRLIGSASAEAFERLAQRLLRESGFTKVEVTGRPSDGGIDGIGVLRMNLVSFQVLFQCKKWKGSVGSSVVRDFRGAMVGRADKGLVITTGTFTAEARREATRDGAPAIDLIDGETLCHLLKERRLGVKVHMVEEIELDENFFNSI